MYRLVILLILIAGYAPLTAQHTESPNHDQEKPSGSKFKSHRVAVLIGHTRVKTSEHGKGLLIPSWGFDYEYWPVPKWGFGLHTDLELQTFIIHTSNGEDELEREYPLVLSLDALYNPWKGLVLEFGGGYEIEPNQGFGLVQVGVEYEIHLPHHWDIFPTVFYDTRIGAYDTWTIALGVGKRF